MFHPSAKMDDKRQAFIGKSLKAGYSVDDCRLAIVGCSRTPHNMGDNDRGQRYNGLHIILRPENIDRFIANAQAPPISRNTDSMIELGRRMIAEQGAQGTTYEHETH